MTDFLIVGFGIAGACIARELEKQNISFHVADPIARNTSSFISGGIINPVTGRKYGLQWNIENLLFVANETYADFENILQQPVYKHTEILRLHKSEEALAAWNEKKHVLENTDWITEINNTSNYNDVLHNTFGGIIMHNAMQVFPETLLNGYAANMQTKGKLIPIVFEYASLITHKNIFTWNGTQYKNIIFCEGYFAEHNPYLQFLSFKPSKGQCLTVNIPGLHTEQILQKEISVVPLSNEIFWVGGTNAWDDLSNTPTQEGLDTLEYSLKQLLKIPYQIISHSAAVRPAMKDRTPVVGKHPEHNNMYILNGLGTKGFSLAPFYARELVQAIIHNKSLPNNVNPNRFNK